MNAFWWAVMAGSIWGVVPVLEKIGLSKTEPIIGLFYRSIGVILGFAILAAFYIRPDDLKQVSARSAAFLITGGFLASFVAQIFFYRGLKIGDVSRVVPVSGAYPLIAFVLGILYLNESVTAPKLIGCLMIIGGAILLR